MTIILTGGSGFLGQSLGQSLTKKGYSIHVLSRNPQNAKLSYPAKVFKWNPTTELPPKEAFPIDNTPFCVIHLAGEPISKWPWTQKRKNRILNSRILGTKHLVQFLNSHKNIPEVFISPSAIEIYGEGKDIDETTPFPKNSPLFLQKVCESWEKEALKLNPNSRVLILRFGIIIGKSGGFLKSQIQIAKKGFYFKILTKRSIWINWIHIEDIINVIQLSLKNKEFKGIYNMVSPHPIQMSNFPTLLSKITGKKLILIPIPLKFIKVLGGEMVKNLLISKTVTAKKLLDVKYSFTYPQIKDIFKS